ncbi:MAG: flagellar biosynthetic protein FliR [Rickettsiales bacterium]|nr:flagellar biosynthetic protein FliR [Rickettsiales bacterium]
MFSLEQFLVPQIFTVLLIFARIGTGIMFMPGFAEIYVNIRFRLILALCIAVLMAPLLHDFMPPVPASPLTLVILLFGESFIGLMIGLVARFIISAMHIVGTIVSTQSSLSMSTQFDPTQASQGTTIGNFMSVTAVVVLFSVDLHLVMLRGLSDSYTLFIPGDFPPVEDFSNYLALLLSKVFDISFQLSAPIIVISLLLYFAAGILSRLMPSLQVFYLILPVQVGLSLFVLMVVFSALMMNYTQYFADTFGGFLEEFG